MASLRTFYFGERWDAPAFDDAEEISTPAGRTCGYCEELILHGESGTLRVFITEDTALTRPVHIECDIRAMVGDVYHLRGECSCFREDGGQHDQRPLREQAHAVVEHLEQLRRIWEKP